MTLFEACNLRQGQPLVAHETKMDEYGRESRRNVNCTFFKTLGDHVVVIVFNNLYLTLTPAELELA